MKTIDLIICDDRKGLTKLIFEEFPNSKVQKCYLHFIRVTEKYLPKEIRKSYREDCLTIMNLSTYEEALNFLTSSLEKYRKYNSEIVFKNTLNAFPEIANIFDYSPRTRKEIYSNNLAESIFSNLRTMYSSKTNFRSIDAIKKMVYSVIFNTTRH